jgi:hypothetical protein
MIKRWQQFNEELKPGTYKIVYEENFLLSFLKERVKKDFNVDLTQPTHTKMIIKNIKF